MLQSWVHAQPSRASGLSAPRTVIVPGTAAPAFPPSCTREVAEHLTGSLRARTSDRPCSKADCPVRWSRLFSPGKVFLSFWAQAASSSLLVLLWCPIARLLVSAVSVIYMVALSSERGNALRISSAPKLHVSKPAQPLSKAQTTSPSSWANISQAS